MKYKVEQSTKFKRQLKLIKKRRFDVSKLEKVVNMLADGEVLDERYCNHKLTDNKRFRNCWECHVAPDWLLVYRRDGDALVLLLVETRSHSDFF